MDTWAPRCLAVGVGLFLGMFALDAFSVNGFPQGLPDFLIHLIPSAIVLGVVAAAWRREWIGAVVFSTVAIAYSVAARSHPSWIAVIGGPLLATAALYAWSWNRHHKAAA